MQKLRPSDIEKIIELRNLPEPVTIANLAIRFRVSERTIYYVLAEWRAAKAGFDLSLEMSNAVN